jgi:2,3-bisphosphoglycerate-dependent phosphoglycerate mutase
MFYLVRHAHAEWTPGENRPLSARGQRDALCVSEVLQAFPIVAIYASPARRAQQTVAPLAAQLSLPIHIAPALCERRLCAGTVDDFEEAVRATWADSTFAHPGGESNAAAQERGVRLVCRLVEQYPAGHVVLATHGNLLSLVLQHYDPSIDYHFWRSLTMPDVYRLEVSIVGPVSIGRLLGRRAS